MTNGTSQGLFVVVAIVIFGIFVSLAYTVFGSQGLTNDLKGLFENSIEQTSTKITETKNLLTPNIKENLDTYSGYFKDYTYDKSTDTISITAKGSPLYLTIQYKDYEDSTLITGNKYYVSGYVYIDGEPVTNEQWRTKSASTYYKEGEFKLDSSTGYFESVQEVTRNKHFILHTVVKAKNGGILKEGTKVEIKNLTLRVVE